MDLCWKVLITQRCPASAEQGSHTDKDFSASHTAWPVRRLGVLKRVTAGKAHPKGYSTQQKLCERRRKGAFGHFAYAVCPPKYALHMTKPCFPEIGKHLTDSGK